MSEQRIPKKIHYCWFGKNPLPELALKCIESWKKYCPDYEIIEWNEENFPMDYNDYLKEAYEARKWAFVSDVARFKILYDEGGVYFDTDVELLKPIDPIVEAGPFMGIESGIKVAPGLGIAAYPGMEIYKEFLDFYSERHFLNEDGTPDLATVVEYATSLFIKHGLKKDSAVQLVAGIYVYPQEYFCPKDGITGKIRITGNTYSIHHYDSSWISDERRYAKDFRVRHKRIPRFIAPHISCFVAAWKYRGMRAAFSEIGVYLRERKKEKQRRKAARASDGINKKQDEK